MRTVMDVRSMRARRVWCASVVAGLLVVPAAAHAATAPVITAGPTITGTPVVHAELVATATWTGDPTPTAAWTWERCAKATGACAPIAGATSDRYRLADGVDLGTYLRVGLRVTNSAGYKEARSTPTSVVVPGPEPPPTATPSPSPSPSPTPGPTPEPPAPPAAVPAPASAPIAAVAPASVPLMPFRFDPFPVVRIKGRLTAAGARVTLLTVRAPRDVTIAVDCAGSGCPARHYELSAGKHRLRKFERDLPAGTRLEIRVTKAGYVGKYTSFVIRRHAEPKRSDRCLNPGAARPVPCVLG